MRFVNFKKIRKVIERRLDLHKFHFKSRGQTNANRVVFFFNRLAFAVEANDGNRASELFLLQYKKINK